MMKEMRQKAQHHNTIKIKWRNILTYNQKEILKHFKLSKQKLSLFQLLLQLKSRTSLA